jgi:hypothetical protein
MIEKIKTIIASINKNLKIKILNNLFLFQKHQKKLLAK